MPARPKNTGTWDMNSTIGECLTCIESMMLPALPASCWIRASASGSGLVLR